MSTNIFWSIIILFLITFLVPLTGHLTKNRKIEIRGVIAFLAILIALFILLLELPRILAGQMLIYNVGMWTPPYGIVLAVDAFNYIVALTVTGLGALVALYSIKHIEITTGLTKFYTLLLLFVVGALGISLTGDLFNLYVFFEIMSISAYALVAFRSRSRAATEGGFKYLLIGSVGSSLILLAIAFLYGSLGTLNIADMATKFSILENQITPILALGLLLAGFSIKAVLVPMHAWKPDALAGTSSEIAGLLAAVSTTIGIYCIFRIVYVIFSMSTSLYLLLLLMSTITMIVGGFMALIQSNLKRLLAYSSISQSGYIVLALTLALTSTSGALGGLFHLVNYAIATCLLFLCVGAVVFRTRSYDMNELGGLAKRMPFTTFAFIIGAFAIVGLPPTNGFVSKLLIYQSTWEAGLPTLTVIAMLMAVITLAYYAKAIYKVFFGTPVETTHYKRELPMSMLIPMFLLLAMCILLGLFPQIAYRLLIPAANALTSNAVYIQGVLG